MRKQLIVAQKVMYAPANNAKDIIPLVKKAYKVVYIKLVIADKGYNS